MRFDAAVRIILLHFELESHGGFFHDGVGFQLVEFEVDGVDAVEHGQLEHLFGQHAEAFGFGEENTVVVSDLFCREGDALVGEHLRHERNGSNGRFELVGHVVDEVCLHLRQPFLPIDADEREDGDHENQEAEEDERRHEGHFAHEIASQIGESHDENAHVCGGVVGKNLLSKFRVGELFFVVLAAEHGTSVCGLDFEVVVHAAQVDAVVLKFIFQHGIQFCAVDALSQRLVREAIEVVVDHFVDEVPLFEKTLAEACLDGVVAEGIERDGIFAPEACPVRHAHLGAVLRVAESDGVQCGLGETVVSYAHFSIQSVLHLVDFEGMCRLVQRALHVFFKLSAAHVLDLMIVVHLGTDQCQDGNEHGHGCTPNCPPFHTANIINFGWSGNLILHTSCKNSIFYRRGILDLLF